MVHCKGKTAHAMSCHNHTTNANHYCHLHQEQAPTGENCPICTELLTNQDALSCTHKVHKSCVQKTVDFMQDDLVKKGYPPQKYGKCPLCRAVQKDILAKQPSWYGTITIHTESIRSLLDTTQDYGGWISKEHIPEELLQQMPNAVEEEQLLFANTAASVLWLANYKELPQQMRLTQRQGGSFRHRVFF